MKEVNYIAIPSVESPTDSCFTWLNGRLTRIDEGSHVSLFVAHVDKEELLPPTDEVEESVSMGVTRAFCIRVEKPLSRDTAINAAEMEAYGLNSAMDVASLNAALSRKYRADQNDEEVKEHDEFIAWVKEELTKIGV